MLPNLDGEFSDLRSGRSLEIHHRQPRGKSDDYKHISSPVRSSLVDRSSNSAKHLKKSMPNGSALHAEGLLENEWVFSFDRSCSAPALDEFRACGTVIA